VKELKIKELRKLKTEDLNRKLRELKLELMKETVKVKMKKVRTTSKLRVLRKGIARILTILSERGIKGR